jgi:hypothetical protein
MNGTKIATCSYCGTRAAFVLTGDARHELSCSACGAQLHDLKMLPKRDEPRPVQRAHTARPGVSSHERAMAKIPDRYERKTKKKKSFRRRFLEEIFDVVEDIFD